MKTVEVRRGAYRDSVTLMQVSQAVATEPGVDAALIAMGTELNVELLADMGFELTEPAGPNDMLVAVAAADEEALTAAKDRIERELTTGRSASPSAPSGTPPRTVGSGVRASGAGLVLISTPGRTAFLDAVDALDAGAHVMLFSDNVSVEHEIALKAAAGRRGLLVMGPDCGTAVVGGVGLGFANVVRPGPVGMVAASGTGAQQLLTLLDAADVGVSHCLGVGGRDLSSAVGGRSTLQALDLLADDDATEVIVLVSKPPAPDVAARVHAHADALGKPVVVGLLGRGQPDLTATAQRVVEECGGTWSPPRSWRHGRAGVGWAGESRGAAPSVGGYLRGLYAGGTLCDEAMVLASDVFGPVQSNIPLEPGWRLAPDEAATGHAMLDFGDDDMTVGRPHPMIDNALRIRRLQDEAANPSCGVVLLDVVLGYGAHADPAAELAPAIRAAREQAGRDLPIVIALIGSRGDPQGLERQAGALHDAGADVHLSNADAVRTAIGLLSDGTG
jgi:FdrA protein